MIILDILFKDCIMKIQYPKYNFLLHIIANLLIIVLVIISDNVQLINIPVLSSLIIFFIGFNFLRSKSRYVLSKYYIWLTIIVLTVNILISLILLKQEGSPSYRLISICFYLAFCLLNIYFSFTKKENKLNVLTLVLVAALVLILSYQGSSANGKIGIISLFFLIPTLLFFLRSKTILNRIFSEMIFKSDFDDQDNLYQIFKLKIFNDEVQELLLNKIENKQYLKLILFDNNEQPGIRMLSMTKLPTDEFIEQAHELPFELFSSAINKIESQDKLKELIDKLPDKYALIATKRLYLSGQLVYTDKIIRFLLKDLLIEFIRNNNELGIIGICRRTLDYYGLTENLTLIRNNFPTSEIIKWYSEEDTINHEIQWSVCSCLELCPDKSALFILHKYWLQIEKNIRVYQFDEKNEPNYNLEIAAGAVLRSLGACSATDMSYKNLENDKHLIDKISRHQDDLKSIRDAMSKLFEDQKIIIDRFDYRIDVQSDVNFIEINSKLKKYKEKAENIEYEIYKLYHNLSSANIIQQVIMDGQKYSPYLRQNAITGLEYLVKKSFLEDNIKTDLLRLIVDFKEEKEKENQTSIYEIRLIKGCKAGEILYVLKKALQNISDTPLNHNTVLNTIVNEIIDKLPTAISFLEEFPLKLMKSATKKYFGLFSENGYNLEHWTRYTPPKDIGDVNSRYLRLINLIQPNSMGIDHNLFKHEIIGDSGSLS